MGYPVDLVAPGIPNIFCWAPGQPFSSSVTPLYLVAEISGVTRGPDWIAADGEPVNGRWTLTQVNSNQWRIDHPSGFSVQVSYASFASALTARTSAGVSYFSSGNLPICQTDFPGRDVPKFIGGFGQITFQAVP